MTKIFIDGSAGTTGLALRQRLEKRADLRLMRLPEEKRRDRDARREAILNSDIAFLCLPDDAAREAVEMTKGGHMRLIDASTAHRTNPDWVYGFPELSKTFRNKIAAAPRVAVPGCYASGFLSLVCPLVWSGFLPRDYPFTCFAVSGYSGGGKAMIAEMESPSRPPELASPRFYGLGNHHKHLAEMQKIAMLQKKPMFTPIVDTYYNGMVVCVPILADVSGRSHTPAQVHEMFEGHYKGARFVHVMPLLSPAEMDVYKLSSNDLRNSNDLQIFVFGDVGQMLLCARLDNLGKGASGAAVQCMNIMLGLDEGMGLESGRGQGLKSR